jgi:OmpA-OmpF porin, OOP family
MSYKKISRLIIIMFFVTAFTPLLAQVDAPSKFEMKKDTDGDGVKNKRDKCPGTPEGVKVDGTGCPLDTDKDGVPDYLDKCPTIPGTAAMNGCQDKDNDGVSDIDDLCPDVPGLARFKGCPDSDGDGIEDSKDKCPNQPGLDRFQGCPDTDGDGITDADDKCPGTAKGIKVDGKGCPADADGDGVVDADDKCPNTPVGVKVDGSGCPADSDGDGVPDAVDKCPTEKGDISNNGCPAVIVKAVPKRLQFASRNINFDSKNALIKTTSYPMLDEVAGILSQYPDYNVRISGHTDTIEKDAETLSQSRADAAKAYLLSKGVSESRIVSAGFGKTRPMVSNVKVADRAQNRRDVIEFYLK